MRVRDIILKKDKSNALAIFDNQQIIQQGNQISGGGKLVEVNSEKSDIDIGDSDYGPGYGNHAGGGGDPAKRRLMVVNLQRVTTTIDHTKQRG